MAATLWLLCARCGCELTVTNASTVLGHGCPRCGDRAVDITDLAPEGGDEPCGLGSVNHGQLTAFNTAGGAWRRVAPWNGDVVRPRDELALRRVAASTRRLLAQTGARVSFTPDAPRTDNDPVAGVYAFSRSA